MMFDVMFQGYLLLFLVSPAFSVSPSRSLCVSYLPPVFLCAFLFSCLTLVLLPGFVLFPPLWKSDLISFFCDWLFPHLLLTWPPITPLYAHKILWLLQFYFFWDFIYWACLSSLLLALFFQKPYHRELERNYNIFPLIHNTANNSFLLPGSSVSNIFCPV